MRCWHLIWTKRAAREILCTHSVPSSFKSTASFACPDQPTGMVTLHGAPSGPPPRSSHWGSVMTALLMRVSWDSLPQLKGHCWTGQFPLATVKREPPSSALMCPDVRQLSICLPKHPKTGLWLRHGVLKGQSTNFTHQSQFTHHRAYHTACENSYLMISEALKVSKAAKKP